MSDRDQAHYLDQGARQRVTLRGAKRRAWMARGGRVMFFVALAAVAAPVAYFLLRPEPQPEEPDLPETAVADTEAGVQRMTNLEFSGRDSQGRPFELVAETAIRRGEGDSSLVELAQCVFYDNVDPEQARSDTQVNAQTCLYDSEARILRLNTDVDLTTDDGYSFRTSQARIYIDDRRAEGDEPVEASGPGGSVRADRWAYQDGGAILHFEGNVRSVILDEGAAAAEDSGQ